MSITTYSELQTAIAGWLDITASDISSQIADLITIGEKRIFREARTRDMELAFSYQMDGGMIPVPPRYVALKIAYLNTSPIQMLERRPASWMYENYPFQSSSGRPKYVSRIGTNFVFGPYPDSQYTMVGVLYQRLIPLSQSPNALFLANPDLYLMAALAEAEPLLGRDPRVAMWDAKFTKILADVNGEDKTEEASGSPIQMRSNVRGGTYGRINW